MGFMRDRRWGWSPTSRPQQMTWLVGWAIVAICWLPGVAGAAADSVATPNHPNVILISLDTVRPDHLSCYGHHRNTTPNIDRIAKKSVVFTQAFSQAPQTFPSHLSIFTSQYPSFAWLNWNLDEREGSTEVLAEALKRAGYVTAAFTGFTKGNPGHNRLLSALAFRAFETQIGPIKLSRPPQQLFNWLETHRHQSFFLFLHGYDAHEPHVLPIQYDGKLFDPTYQGPLPGTEMELWALFSPDKLRRPSDWDKYNHMLQQTYLKRLLRNGEVSTQDLEHMKAVYDAQLFYLDQGLGRFFKALENLKLMERTLVIIVSDHGQYLGEHGSYAEHYGCFDEVNHIILIVYDPHLREGKRVRQVVQGVDVMPTILELAGVPIPAGTKGRSLASLLKGGSHVTQEEIAVSADVRMRTIRTPAWKLIDTEGGPKALYDLVKDPHEQRNVIDKHQEIAVRLQAQLDVRMPASETAPPPGENPVQQMRGHGYW